MAAAVASLNAAFDMIAASFRRPLQDESTTPSAVSQQDSPCLSSTNKSAVGGVGITFSKDELGNFVVRSLQAGSSAAASGIQPGDVILSVDDTKTEGMGMRQVASAISGPVHTYVALTIRRGAQTGKVELMRMSGLLRGVVGKVQSLSVQPSPLSSADGISRRTHESAFSLVGKVQSLSVQPSPLSSADGISRRTHESAFSPHRIAAESSTADGQSRDAPPMPSAIIYADSSKFDREIHQFAFAEPSPNRTSAAAIRSEDVAPSLKLLPANASTKHSSKKFQRSEFFLAVKDARALNAIVAADCQHLIDDLTSPGACEAARERLIASRTRLPMADMKKVARPCIVV
jgi:hypothetical protein